MKEPINLGFWKRVKENADKEKQPILTLAPMADVTDSAFRRIIAKYSRMGKKGGGPDVLWTEFVSADGLCSSVGRKVLLRDLAFSEKERPIVAQLFTSHPEKMREAASLIASLGFDGLDINMGCPDRSIEKQCAGAAMMKDIKSAIAIIKAAREGILGAAPNAGTFLGLSNSLREIATVSTAGHSSRTPPTQAISARSNSVRPSESSVSVAAHIPVSVKTRIGYNKIEIDTWIRILLEQKLPVLTIHLRTRKEMSDMPAHWELMPEIIKLRNEISPETLILGNGDVESLADAYKKAEGSGCDGIMFGRAIFGNPWLFDRKKVSVPERLSVMVEHTELFKKLLGDVKSFATMKKHYKAYVNGWDGAKELRIKLMEAKDAREVKKIVEDCLK
jgi:tRNA-dihydrouridine synthase